MSSSWRSPARSAAKPVAAVKTPPLPPQPVQAEVDAGVDMNEASRVAVAPASAIQMPAGPLKIRENDRRPAAPKASLEVRCHNDPPTAKTARTGGAGSRLSGAVTQGATWLGAMTIGLYELLKDRCLRVARRLGLAREGRGSSSRGSASSLPRQTVVLGFAALAAVILLVVWIIGERGDSAPSPAAPGGDVAVKDANLSGLLPAPPASSVRQGQESPPAVRGQTPPVVQPPATGATPPADAAQPKPRLSRTSTDPREKGQRYYILATYSVNKEDYLMPLLEYLWSQGVEAGAINAHNSGFFQVIALQGFTREELNAKAHKQYEDQLRTLGRKWKAQGGGDDLQGLYLQEYSGTQAKLSILKAN